MFPAFLLSLFSWLSVVSAAATASKAPIVDLGYSIYQGNDLGNGQNEFIGVRFAAPPLGNLRFRSPQPPLVTKGIQPANKFQPVCFGVSQGLASGLSEDCLFLNIWAPSDATPNSRLPVFFWIQGGGYETNANPNQNGSVVVEATGNKMIWVGLNYRVGPFGFLTSEKVRANGDLNAGFLDQRMALEWVQQHITAFGGDPRQVTLVGASAGAGSVALHLIANGGQPTNLFRGGFGVSPFFPAQFRSTELEWQFDLFSSRAGCGQARDPLACLRSQNSTTLQTANVGMPFPGRVDDSEFPFIPSIDGVIFQDFPYRMFETGRFVKVPVVFGDDTNEGTIFVANASSTAQMSTFMQDNYPQLSTQDTDNINALYPLITPNPFNNHAPFFASLEAAFGETTFTCPGLTMSTIMANFVPSWNYRFNVLTASEIASGLGVSHTSDLSFVFAPPDTSPLTPILQAYYTSFVRSLNPNAHPVSGSIEWPQFDGRTNRRILLQPNLTVETVPKAQLDRCDFWRGLAIKMEQ
ncbi:hypothetical protein M422DRAFT_776444 [Sphaerobolus stellatus SS14]|nr:hypothetical protein M422DRAFT_776444 [Sphaerobolus stellatus SS14]